MPIYSQIDQTKPVILTHVSTSLKPLLTGRIASVAVHGNAKAHRTGNGSVFDEYVGVEEDDVCFEVNAFYASVEPLHINPDLSNGRVFNYAIAIGAHDLLGTPELQCAESDGLHVFRADGKPVDIDLNLVPFKLLVHQQDRQAFELLLTQQSCWSEAIGRMTPESRKSFFDKMIHELPGEHYKKLGLNATEANSYLRDPKTIAQLIPNSPPGLPFVEQPGVKQMKVSNERCYSIDSTRAVRRPLISTLKPASERNEQTSLYYGQLHSIVRAQVVKAKITNRLIREQSSMFHDFSQQVFHMESRTADELLRTSKMTSKPPVGKNIPDALRLILNTRLTSLAPEYRLSDPETQGLSNDERARALAQVDTERKSRRYEWTLPEPYVLPISDSPVFPGAVGLTVTNMQDYTTEEGCNALWSHLYWNVGTAQPPPMDISDSAVSTVENLLGSIDELTKDSVRARSQAMDKEAPTIDAGSFSM